MWVFLLDRLNISHTSRLFRWDYKLDKHLLGQANSSLIVGLILSLICYLALKSSCHLFIGSFSIFFSVLADCEVPHITLAQSTYRISTISAVLYVNIWEFSKSKFKDPKALKIVYQVSYSELVISWEFSKCIY